MPYRRNRDSAMWSQKLHHAEAILSRTGVPRWVFAEERLWDRFIWSGYAADMENSRYFDVRELTEAQLRPLADAIVALGGSKHEIKCCTSAHPQRFALWDELEISYRS